MRQPRTCILLALLLSPLLPRGAQADQRPSVMVLYFDNNSGDPELAPLGKGLADMMITDLSQVPEIEIVEREKLEQLLKELELQRSSYFDPATAVKLGGGIGAQYALTGAFSSLGRNLRIDLRIVRVQGGEVVKASQVSGGQQRFFDLQRELVTRFLDGLGATLRVPAVRQDKYQRDLRNRQDNRVPDMDVAVSYGRALDSLDRGEPAAAEREMEKVLLRAPGFVLGRTRYLQILRAQVQGQPTSPADQKTLTDCRAVIASSLLCPGGPSPQAQQPKAPPAPEAGPAAPSLGQRGRGVALEIGLSTSISPADGGAVTPLRTGLLVGYKLSRFLFGLFLDLSYASASFLETPASQSAFTFLLGPGVRAALLRSANQRMELLALLNFGYGLTTLSGTSGHRLLLETGPGLRYWLHPQLGVGAVIGLRGDFAVSGQGARTGQAQGHLLGLFAALQMTGVF